MKYIILTLALLFSLQSFGAQPTGNGNGGGTGCSGNVDKNGKVCSTDFTYTKSTTNDVTTFVFNTPLLYTNSNITQFAYKAIQDIYPTDPTYYQNRGMVFYPKFGETYTLDAHTYRYFYTYTLSGTNVVSIKFWKIKENTNIFKNYSK